MAVRAQLAAVEKAKAAADAVAKEAVAEAAAAKTQVAGLTKAVAEATDKARKAEGRRSRGR